MSTDKVSLVLSSGGARGLAHLGVIESLVNDQIEISEISGSSIGSLIAVFYASGELNVFKDWVFNLDKMGVFSYMDFSVSGQGLLKGDRVFNQLKKIIPDRKIEDLNIPVSVVTTNISQNKEEVIRSGSMYDAIRASCSIPGLVKPFVRNENEFVDGGVLNPLPINALQSKDNIITVNLNAQPTKKVKNLSGQKSGFYSYFSIFRDFFINQDVKKSLGFYDITYRSVHLMQNQLANFQINNHKTWMNINIPCDSCFPLEFYRAKEMVNLGSKIYYQTKKNY